MHSCGPSEPNPLMQAADAVWYRSSSPAFMLMRAPVHGERPERWTSTSVCVCAFVLTSRGARNAHSLSAARLARLRCAPRLQDAVHALRRKIGEMRFLVQSAGAHVGRTNRNAGHERSSSKTTTCRATRVRTHFMPLDAVARGGIESAVATLRLRQVCLRSSGSRTQVHAARSCPPVAVAGWAARTAAREAPAR